MDANSDLLKQPVRAVLSQPKTSAWESDVVVVVEGKAIQGCREQEKEKGFNSFGAMTSRCYGLKVSV